MAYKGLAVLAAIAFLTACDNFSGKFTALRGFTVKGSWGDVSIAKGTYDASLSLSSGYATFDLGAESFSIQVPSRYRSFPSSGRIAGSEIGQAFDVALASSREVTSSNESLEDVSCQLSSPYEKCEMVRRSDGKYEEECETITTGTAPARVLRTHYNASYSVRLIQKGSEFARFAASRGESETDILEQGYCSR